MIRILFAIIFLIFISFFQSKAQSDTNVKDRNVIIKVADEWVSKIRNYNTENGNEELIKEFEKYIYPDTLNGSISFDHEGGGFLTYQLINLDDDTAKELLCLIGWSESYPTMAVLKNVNNTWYLLYTEPFYMFYEDPKIEVAINSSPNKTFYFRWLYERGSGIFCDAYHFYKIIDKRVYHCLELVNSARIYGWGLFLNQDIEMAFKFKTSKTDEINVTYKYNFFPGAVYDTDVSWDGHEELSFVKDKKSVVYTYNNRTYSYQPQFIDKPNELNDKKIACFGAFGNDTLFIDAYSYELKNTLISGSKEEKSLLNRYLELVRENKKAVAPSGELEEKGSAGDLKFYGIKEKK